MVSISEPTCAVVCKYVVLPTVVTVLPKSLLTLFNSTPLQETATLAGIGKLLIGKDDIATGGISISTPVKKESNSS